MADIEIITTSDGSHTLRNKTLNETFHSIHGAIRESRHVFIQNGLLYRLDNSNPGVMNILEVGFGTGLNALLTALHASGSGVQFHFKTLESDPLDRATVGQLNFPQMVGPEGPELFRAIHDAPWEHDYLLLDNFKLFKHHCLIEQTDLGKERFDLVYFDAFAPSKQPGIWDISILQEVERSMKAGAIWVTYCAQGQLKRNLRSIGLTVETLPGPPGKKEMVRALKS